MTTTAVVFDLDDTLATVDRDRQTLLDEATEAVGAPEVERAAYLDVHGRDVAAETRAPIFARLLDGDGSPSALADAYRRVTREALIPVDGAADLVRTLRSTYRVGLLTDGPVRAQRDKLRALGWTDLFDATVVTGSLPASKPDPRAFEAVLDALDATPAETVYVGDRVGADVGGATAAGLRAVQVCYDGGPDPDPRAVATVRRERLAAELPAVLADL